MSAAQQDPIKASTQEHLDIKDIRDDIVVFKDGSCCMILKTTAVNFGLLSEAEQDSTIYAYAGLLNSLSFPIQIIIHSKRKDISSYIKLIEAQERKQQQPKLRELIGKYRAFVEKIVKENDVLDKKFYIVVTFAAIELGLTSSFKGNKLPYPINYILEKAQAALIPRRDHLMAQLTRIGLKTKQLNTQELIELYYNIYNPDLEGQKLVPSKNYSTPLVQAAIDDANQEDKEEPEQNQPENLEKK